MSIVKNDFWGGICIIYPVLILEMLQEGKPEQQMNCANRAVGELVELKLSLA